METYFHSAPSHRGPEGSRALTRPRHTGSQAGGQGSNCDVHFRDNAKAQGVLGGKSVTEPGQTSSNWPRPTRSSQRAPDVTGPAALPSWGSLSQPFLPVSSSSLWYSRYLESEQHLGKLLPWAPRGSLEAKIIPRM